MGSVGPLLGGTGTSNYSLDQILQSTQPQPQPSGFRRVLGGLVGGIGNLVAPGLGSVIGNAIMGGSGLAGGLSSDSAKYLQLQQQMNAESEQFEAISSVMKSRHDASMAAIRNIS
jgi:hypothetical protein